MNIEEETNHHKRHSARPDFLAFVFTAAIGGLIYGYDSGFEYELLLPDLNELEHSADIENLKWPMLALMTTFPMGILIGLVMIAEPFTAIGHTQTSFFIFGNLYITGAVIGVIAFHIWMLVAARFFMLIAIGVTLYCSPIYIAEVSPHKLRGAFVSMFYLFVTAGQLLAYLVSKALSSVPDSWRWMFAIGGVMALVQYHLAKTLFPEYLSSSYAEVAVVGLMTMDSRRRNFRRPEFRYLVCTCCLVAQQFVGLHMVIYSIPKLLQLTGYTIDKENLYSLVLPCYSALGCLVTMNLVDSWGRRKLLLISIFGIFVSLSILTYAATVYEAALPIDSMADKLKSDAAKVPSSSPMVRPLPKAPFIYGGTIVNRGSFVEENQRNEWLYNLKVDELCIFPLIALQFYFFFYSFGMGVIPWIISSEIYPSKFNKGLFGSIFCFGTNGFWYLYTPTISNIYGFSNLLFLHCLLAFVVGTSIFFYVPETKEIQIKDMERTLRRAKSYHMWKMPVVANKKDLMEKPVEEETFYNLENNLSS